MLIAFPTILNWTITSVAPEAELESALQGSKCSGDCNNYGSDADDITTGTFEPYTEPIERVNLVNQWTTFSPPLIASQPSPSFGSAPFHRDPF